MSKLALWDMDGTLSDDRHRRVLYVEGEYTEYWKVENILADELFPEAKAEVARLEADGWNIGILTARTEELNRSSTEFWLQKNNIHANPIILRPREFRYMRGPEFKSKVVEGIVHSGNFEQVVLYENDLEVVKAVQKLVGPEKAIHCTWEEEAAHV